MQERIFQALTVGDTPAALRMARQWVATEPHRGSSWLVLSAVLGRMGSYREAEQAAQRAAAAGSAITRGVKGGRPRVLTLISLESAWCGYQAGRGLSFPNTADVNDGLHSSMSETFIALDGSQIPWETIRRGGPFDVIFNGITVAERTEESLRHVSMIAKELGLPMINDPGRVARTTRTENSRQLDNLPDVRFPQTVAVPLTRRGRGASEELLSTIEREEFTYPLIVRWSGYQGGTGMVRCLGPDDVRQLRWPRHIDEALIIEYIETRADDGHYRKLRIFCVGNQLIPRHLLIGDVWMLHVTDSSGTAYRNVPGPERDEILAFDADWEAWAGQRAAAGARQVRDAVALDFFGIDCNVLPDGRLLVFEANPAMNLQVIDALSATSSEENPVRRINTRRTLQIARAFADLVRARSRY